MKSSISLLLLLLDILTPIACLGQGVTDDSGFFQGQGSNKKVAIDLRIGETEQSKVQSPFTPQLFQPDIGATPLVEKMKKEKGAVGREFEDLCPKSERLARKKANSDVAAFLKKTPLGTWDLFMHKFRQQYSTCPPFVKRAYIGAARDALLPQRKSMFQR
jgi:hypothetical protein